ncbi:hypothetical protein GBA52_028477 [Prunus armeniaca]|nr:hypothetical protein GBA52_028477 [Prunus armeniaca]
MASYSSLRCHSSYEFCHCEFTPVGGRYYGQSSRQWNFQNVCMVLDRKLWMQSGAFPLEMFVSQTVLCGLGVLMANTLLTRKIRYHKIHAICSDFFWRQCSLFSYHQSGGVERIMEFGLSAKN